MKHYPSILLFTLAAQLFGQMEYFTPYPMEPGSKVEPDTMGVYDDSFTDSIGGLKIYRKGTEVWLIEALNQGSTTWRMNETGSIVNVQYHDFNGDRPELILTWQSLSGHSGRHGGVAEQYQETVVYDLQASRVILHLDRLIYSETWSLNWLEDPDSTDLDTLGPRSWQEDEYCEEYQLSIKDSLIIMTPDYTNQCGDMFIEEVLSPYTLVWRKHAFYRKD